MHEASGKLLNQAVGDELCAVHQYMYFHFHCDDQGLDLLAGLFEKTAIEEMLHVEWILFLKGDVEMTVNDEVKTVHHLEQTLEMACGIEKESIAD